MTFSMSRRSILGAAAVGAALAAVPRPSWAASGKAEDQLAALERKAGGRLGVAILDTANGQIAGRHQDARFAMCSTFKFVLAAAVLARVEQGKEDLTRRLTFTKADLMGNSPVSEHYLSAGMTVAEMCRATMTTSDNTAANVLLPVIGGPAAITAFARRHGDQMTRLDRMEPELNIVSGADERDTTTPAAMAGLMRTLVLGDALSPASREILIGWLCSCRTGTYRLRAGLPDDWIIGNKTGTGQDGPTNDIAVIWPHTRPPLIVTAYYERTGRTMKENNTVIAEVGRIAASLG